MVIFVHLLSAKMLQHNRNQSRMFGCHSNLRLDMSRASVHKLAVDLEAGFFLANAFINEIKSLNL